jgi:outer membrane protein
VSRSKLPALLCAAAVWLAAGSARADNLRQVFELAQQHNPALRSAAAAYQAALTKVPQARASLLPQLGAAAQFGDTSLRNSPNPLLLRFGMPHDWDYVERDLSLTATQALWKPADQIAVSQAELGARIAYTQWRAEEQQLMVDVAAAYFDRLAAQDSAASLQRQADATAQQLASAQRNFAAGNGTIVDVRDAQARNDLLNAQRLAANNQIDLSDTALQRLTGAPFGALATLRADLTPPGASGAQPDWAQRAAQDNLQVRAAALALEVAHLQARRAAAGNLPTLQAYASVQRNSDSGGTPLFPFGTRSNAASVGVQMQWPIFTGFGVQSQQDEAARRIEQAQADLDDAALGAAQAARSAFLGLQSGLAQLQALRAAIASSQSALQANSLGYKVGMRVNLDVLNALAQLYDTQRQADRTRYDLLLAGLKLRLAAGALGPADLDQVDAMLN